MPASIPTINDKLTIKLIDWETPPQTHEPMGSFVFLIKDILEGKVDITKVISLICQYRGPFWVNIYGPPSGADKKYEKLMTEVPETGRLKI